MIVSHRVAIAMYMVLSASAPCLALGCSTQDCASIKSDQLGDSYCKIDGPSKIPIREIKIGDAFAFVKGNSAERNGIGITLKSDAQVCKPNNDLIGKVNMKLKRESGGGFMLKLDNKSGFVPLDIVSKTPGYILWLHGHDDKNDFDYFVYLRDEPQNAPEIVKHYRLEVFDKNCLSHMPATTSVARISSPAQCVDGSKVEEQTGSGDGYEPKK